MLVIDTVFVCHFVEHGVRIEIIEKKGQQNLYALFLVKKAFKLFFDHCTFMPWLLDSSNDSSESRR